MFYQTLRSGSIPLTGPDADAFFNGKIWGDVVLRDNSFVATLRALLGDRMGDGHLYFRTVALSDRNDTRDHQPTPDELQLIWCDGGDKESREARIAEFKEHMHGFEGYRYVEKVAQFFGKAFQAHAWSCQEQNSAIILADSMDIRKAHILQTCIPAVLPWYFVGEGISRFTEDELALIRSLNSKDDLDYRAALSLCARKFDMREFIIRRKLDGITKHMHEIELRNAEDRVQGLERDIHDLYNQIESYVRERSDIITRVYGLKARLEEGGAGSELTDLFLSNPFLHLNSVSDVTVNFTASGPLENWDDDVAESVIEDTRSYVYRKADDCGVDIDRFRNLLRAIFLDRKVKVMTYADYRLDLYGGIDTGHFDTHPGLEEYMPNPHIDHFDCLGDYRRQILDCLMRGATLQAFNYCLASSRSLNWGDTTVVKEFVYGMCCNYTDIRCYQLPDGTNVAFDQAMEWANNR